MKKFSRLLIILAPVILAAIVNFISLPLIYNNLNKLDTGVWFLLIDIAAIALAMDFGISNIQVRTMSQNVENSLIVGQTFRAGKKALGVIASLIFICGIIASILYYFDSEQPNLQINISLLLFLIAISVNLYGYSFVGLLRTYEKFAQIAVVAFFSNFIYLAIIIVFLRIDAKLLVLSSAYLVRNLVSFLGFNFYSKFLVDRANYAKKFKYTREHAVIFFNTTILYLYLAIESIILSINYSPIIVATYVAQRKFFDFTKSGVDAYLTSVFPQMSRNSTRNSPKKVFLFGISIAVLYLTLYLITPFAIKYLSSSQYIVEPNLILLIMFQFIFSSVSTYIRQNNIASHRSSLALASALSELTVKILLSMALIPIYGYISIPASSICGAFLSIILGSELIFKDRK